MDICAPQVGCFIIFVTFTSNHVYNVVWNQSKMIPLKASLFDFFSKTGIPDDTMNTMCCHRLSKD